MSMPREGLEPAILVLEVVKVFRALHRAATVNTMGMFLLVAINYVKFTFPEI